MKMLNPEWNAWYKVMPGSSSNTLHVTGVIDVQSEGIELELNFHSLEKSSPPTLVLKLIDRHITIPRQPGATVVRVHYSQNGNPGDVKGIKILDPSEVVFVEIDISEILVVQ